MKKFQLAAVIAAAGMVIGSAYAASLDAPVPPSFNDAPDNIQRPSKSGETIEEKVTNLNQKTRILLIPKPVKKTPRLRKLSLRKT